MGFEYKGRKAYCEEVSIEGIAASVATPTFVYSRAAMVAQIRAYEEALAEVPHVVAYAVKANTNQWVIGAMAAEGAGGDVHSGGELYRALHAGIPHDKIVYSGVGKTREELEEALKAEIMLFSVESIAELQALNSIASSMGRVAPIALRVNPDVDPQTHPYISTGLRTAKFGIPISDALDVYESARLMPGVNPCGIHIHIGSQLTELSPIQEAVSHGAQLVGELRTRGFNIEYFDAGGGLGINYDKESPPSPAEHVNTILKVIEGMKLTLILEPGRSLVGNAGMLLTKVVYRKTSGEKDFIVVDAGMNDLLRPSLYSAYHDIKAVDLKHENVSIKADLVGPVCEEGDFFARDRNLPDVPEGGLIGIMSAGAYGFTMASNYNSRRKPAEVLVDGDRFALIRRRETYADLINTETSLKLEWASSLASTDKTL